MIIYYCRLAADGVLSSVKPAQLPVEARNKPLEEYVEPTLHQKEFVLIKATTAVWVVFVELLPLLAFFLVTI
ncbi:hypothetical protein [Sphingobacterium anhuiense]|uniref:hypothetical protein n=1 Tax=Sphingobacterium anhuiense TaxID=493780 RepID=UPI003C2F230E